MTITNIEIKHEKKIQKKPHTKLTSEATIPKTTHKTTSFTYPRKYMLLDFNHEIYDYEYNI